MILLKWQQELGDGETTMGELERSYRFEVQKCDVHNGFCVKNRRLNRSADQTGLEIQPLD